MSLPSRPGGTLEEASDKTTTEQLAHIMVRTLPEGGLDRITPERVEEMLSVPALTAHI